jgi:hypothetical protein
MQRRMLHIYSFMYLFRIHPYEENNVHIHNYAFLCSTDQGPMMKLKLPQFRYQV